MIKQGQTYDVFISYNSLDHQTVQRIVQQLSERGIAAFLDRWYLPAGIPWPQQLENVMKTCRAVAIFLGPNGMGRWQKPEMNLALNRQSNQNDFPVIPVLLPGADPVLGFLALQTWVDLRQGVDEFSVDLLTAAIQGKPPGSDVQLRMDRAMSNICPYRGLRFFREEDAPFFFGRDAFTGRLRDAVVKHALIVVVGASGSGKSSVVRAGLLPHLRKPGTDRTWDVGTMVPGDRPLQNMAAVFAPLLEPGLTEAFLFEEISKWTELLESGKAHLSDLVERALQKQQGTNRFLLVVDQWEELYAPSQNERLRQKFFDEILTATSATNLSVILTVRGDFYHHLINDRSFADQLVDGAVVPISRMTSKELAQIIELPANKVGLQFQPGLVGRILDQVQERPESLSLLEFMLEELWKKRQGQWLTHEAYEQLGELEGAIANHAKDVIATLSRQQREIAKRIFLQLVRPGGEGSAANAELEIITVRRRIAFDELPEESREVVQGLAKAHLIVTGRSEATGKEVIDLVHEALIREWSSLKDWIKEDHEFLLWRETLRTLMNISAADENGRSTLLRGNLLQEAKTWLQNREKELNPREKEYIRRSARAEHRQLLWLGGVLLL
ncbi:MAG: toll/interleukin-1 receptor domain-containing protein, partial [Cytophagales bacterium]|nr:toll/interleukin-1 receptor domain-containing protein [Cytophagales bacterium]